MSQTVTYKTKYKSLNAIKKVLDELTEKGVFGEGAHITAKGDRDFDPGAYYKYSNMSPEERQKGLDEIIMRVHANDPNAFGDGFYDKGFVVSRDKSTGEIYIAYDFDNEDPKHEKATAETREKINNMVDAGVQKDKAINNLKGILKGMTITEQGNEGWVLEGEIPEELLREIKSKLPNQ